MHGGPSQVDLLDPKPELTRRDGQPPPGEIADDEVQVAVGVPIDGHRPGADVLDDILLIGGNNQRFPVRAGQLGGLLERAVRQAPQDLEQAGHRL